MSLVMSENGQNVPSGGSLSGLLKNVVDDGVEVEESMYNGLLDVTVNGKHVWKLGRDECGVRKESSRHSGLLDCDEGSYVGDGE